MHDHDAVGEDPVEHEASAGERIRDFGGIGAGPVAGRAAGIVLVSFYGWWAVALPPFSAAATAAVLLAGGAAVVWGAYHRRGERPEIEVRRAGPWAALVALGGVWQLAAYLQQPRDEHPTLSSLANGLLDSQPARVAGFVLWIVVTVRLSRR